MIALMFLAGAIVWLVVAVALALWIPSRLGMERFGWVVSLMLFPALLVAPIVDEWIGSRQFKALCEREAVIYLSSDWQEVRKAKNISPGQSIRLSGYLVRIQEREFKYKNIETGEVFLRYKAFYNYGGILMDKMGLRLSGAPADCWPTDVWKIRENINLQWLLDQGENK